MEPRRPQKSGVASRRITCCGQLKEWSSGSGTSPEFRRWRGRQRRPPGLGHYFHIPWEADDNVPSRSREVGD